MNQITNILQQALQDNLVSTIMIIICVAMLYVLNSVLGLAIAYFKSETDIKKFIVSQARNIVVLLCIFGTCYALNVFAITLNLIDGITLSTDYVCTVEIIGIVVVWCVDLAKDIFEKLKSFKDLKYVSYDDVHYNDGNGVEQ